MNKIFLFGALCVIWLEETFGYGGDLCKKLITMDLNLGGERLDVIEFNCREISNLEKSISQYLDQGVILIG